MKRNKEQAVYNYLPGKWISIKSDKIGKVVSAKILSWNTIKMEGIYEPFIESEIDRNIKIFEAHKGNISEFPIGEERKFYFVEPACNENYSDIKTEISPKFFFCGKCGEIRNIDYTHLQEWKCSSCGGDMKQLQLIYSCECGAAYPVSIPKNKDNIRYLPEKRNRANFNIIYTNFKGKDELLEMIKKCDICGKALKPSNVTNRRHYKAHSITVINMIDKADGEFLAKNIISKKLLLARWLGLLDDETYKKYVKMREYIYDNDEITSDKRSECEKSVQVLVDAGIISKDDFSRSVDKMLAQEKGVDYNRYVEKVEQILSRRGIIENSEGNISNLASRLAQYYTLKSAGKIIDLAAAIENQKELEIIESEEDIYNMNKKCGISNAQVSSNVELITCTYGYTRCFSSPAAAKEKLKLVSFGKYKDTNSNIVYSNKLETEGIFIELDRAKIIKWLFDNKFINETVLPDLDDEKEVKAWFIENINSNEISNFGRISSENEILKLIYSLLHTISHTFIKACEISGLASNSISEIIIPETATIFIYAQSAQGLSLGSLSGMFENNYKQFLVNAYNDNKKCIFDPVCSERDNSACSACLILPEVSCKHINSYLGRKYLYGGKEGDKEIIGFWEMV